MPPILGGETSRAVGAVGVCALGNIVHCCSTTICIKLSFLPGPPLLCLASTLPACLCVVRARFAPWIRQIRDVPAGAEGRRPPRSNVPIPARDPDTVCYRPRGVSSTVSRLLSRAGVGVDYMVMGRNYGGVHLYESNVGAIGEFASSHFVAGRLLIYVAACTLPLTAFIVGLCSCSKPHEVRHSWCLLGCAH